MSLDLVDRAFWQNLYEAVSTRVVSFSPTPVVYAIVDSVPHVYLLMLWVVGITTIVSLVVACSCMTVFLGCFGCSSLYVLVRNLCRLAFGDSDVLVQRVEDPVEWLGSPVDNAVDPLDVPHCIVGPNPFSAVQDRTVDAIENISPSSELAMTANSVEQQNRSTRSRRVRL